MEQSKPQATKSVENVFDTDRNIGDLINLIQHLREDKSKILSFREVFFKNLKSYIA